MFQKKYIFISHSSENKEIAEQICSFLSNLGINGNHIFCSSIVGQGVNNGEKLNEAIAKAIKESKILVYIISRDFVDSSYCMEELGVGWFLSQTQKATCFFLKLPDIELSDLSGFINSKIDKFSFIDENHKGELGLFAENIFCELHRKLPKHSYLINAENTFFSATKTALDKIVKKQSALKEKNEKRKNEIEILNRKIKNQEKNIDNLRNLLKDRENSNEREKSYLELNTIRNQFFIFGVRKGITNIQFQLFSKSFWFNMVNKYLKLEKEMGYEDGFDADMEILIASIFSSNNDEAEAYEHLKKYVNLCDSNIYPDFYENVNISNTNDMSEIINSLKTKIEITEKGIVQDSYIETLKHLEKRKAALVTDLSN